MNNTIKVWNFDSSLIKDYKKQGNQKIKQTLEILLLHGINFHEIAESAYSFAQGDAYVILAAKSISEFGLDVNHSLKSRLTQVT